LQGGRYGDHFYPNGERSVSEGPQSQLDKPSNFVPRSDFMPKRGRWYCYEFRVKLNTVIEEGEYEFIGEGVFGGDRGHVIVTKEPRYSNDGRITAWVDGKILTDYDGITLRYTNDLKLDRLEFCLHAKCSTKENSIWYSDIVLSQEYIGMAE